jgi:hypothetical protein
MQRMPGAIRSVLIAAAAGVTLFGMNSTPAVAQEDVDAAVGLAITIPLGEDGAPNPSVGLLSNVEGGWREGEDPLDDPATPADPELDDSERLVSFEEAEAAAEADATAAPPIDGPAELNPEVVQRAVGDAVEPGEQLLYLPPDIVLGAMGGQGTDILD